MNENMHEAEKLTTVRKQKAAELARLIAELPEQEQDKVYYMLKGSELFNNGAVTAIPQAAAVV